MRAEPEGGRRAERPTSRLSEAVGGRRYIYRAKVPSPIPAVGAPDGTGGCRQRADTGRKVGRAARFGFRHGGSHRLSWAREQGSALAWPDGGDAGLFGPSIAFGCAHDRCGPVGP